MVRPGSHAFIEATSKQADKNGEQETILGTCMGLGLAMYRALA